MRAAVLALAWLVATGAPAQEVVAARTLRVGTVLAPDDLVPAPGARHPAAAIARLAGLEVRRAIYAGRPVTQTSLGPPTLVGRNDIVTMTYRDGGLGIRADGRALDAGGRGERIRVLNLSSRQPVTATVTGPGRVEVAR